MVVVVFDTETMGMVSQDLLNVGYSIIDIDTGSGEYKVLKERDYLVSKLYNNSFSMINDTFVGAAKYGKYVALLDEKKIVKRSLKQIFKTMQNDFKKYGVVFGYAYNSNFDLDKFKESALRYNLVNPFENIKVFDIWAYATNLICNEDYKKWCVENNQLTKTETCISTTVEALTRYLTNNLEFVENHTALSDVSHERNILAKCVELGCDITKSMKLKRFIPSDKIFKKVVIINGAETEIEYKKMSERNGVITFK